MIKIEIFGPGCRRCAVTTAAVEQAVRALGLPATVEHISDPREMARRRVLFTPTVQVNGEVRCSGRVPTVAEVTDWLLAAKAA